MITRKQFVTNSSLLAMAVAAGIPVLANNKLPALGVQLYMVKEDMQADAAGTLKKLAGMGYTQLESFDGNKGMFWGMTNTEFKKVANDSGLQLISSHYNDDNIKFETKAEKAAEIGMKYLICPWKGPQKSIDDFKRIAEEFNNLGKVCKANGLRFAYHNHDYPFKSMDGVLPMDVLLENTDSGLVDFQMDFYYVVTEQQDPEAYLEKYKNRFRLCHLRDRMKIPLPKNSTEESACDLGTGIINYRQLLSKAKHCGMEYFFMEQSRFYKETPLQSAAINAAYLKKLRLD